MTASQPPVRQPATRPLFHRALRALLELDRPVPERTEDELVAEVERNYNWNFGVNLLDGTAFLLGAAFIASSTILPLFLSKLTQAPLAFGILAVLANAGWFLPQIFTANAMERLSRKKPVVINLGLFTERLPVWLMPLAALLAADAPVGAVVLLLGAYAWFSIGSGVVAISWQDLVARCFPVTRRGRWLGLTTFFGTLAGAAGSLLAAYLLQAYAFPMNFFYAFLLGAAGITASWVFLALTREPVQPARPVRRSNREYLSSLPGLVAEDDNFRRYLIARGVMALGWMASGFVTVSAVTRWQTPDSSAGLYTLALLGGQTAGNLFFGFLADRKGHKLALELGCGAAILAMVLAGVAPGPGWYYAVFALNGVVLSAVSVSGILIIMEFGDPLRRPTYLGIANTTVGVVSAIAPLLGAALAALGYGLLFAVAAGVNTAALILFRFLVREPRHLHPGRSGEAPAKGAG